MKGDPKSVRFVRPSTVTQAVAEYARDPEALPLAGGTDVMVAWNSGLLNGRSILDLSAVPGWSSIRRRDGALRIGALCTHSAIRDDAGVRRHFQLLAQACSMVGSVQIQNRGTLGGNIANASPAGDTLPVLAVYEARVRTVSSSGPRELALLDVFAGVKKTRLLPSELIESVDLPFPAVRPSRDLWRKVGPRSAQAISKLMAAGLLWLERDGRVRELRFALGSMAPTVRRLTAAEAFLAGKKPSRDVVREACRLLEKDVSPIDDFRSTAEYRLRVAQNLLADLLAPGSRLELP